MARDGKKAGSLTVLPDRIVDAGIASTTFGVDSPLPWILAFAFLTLLWCSLVWFPLARIPARHSIEYNEGLSCYREQAAVTGQKPYGAPPSFIYVDYPPLSFHLVGYLGRLTGELNQTGRWVSVFAYLLIAAFSAMIVHRLSRSWRCGIYAALCWLIWLAAYAQDRIGYNDPHLLGMAFSIAGLYCFVREPEDRRWVIASGVVFIFSLFIKHSLIAFPAAVGMYLLSNSRKLLAVWLAAGGVAGAILLTLSLALDGQYFLQHLTFPRTLHWYAALDGLGPYLYLLQVAFVSAIIWAFVRRVNGTAKVLIWAAAIAHVTGAGFRAGTGAANNHLFDSLLSLALISGFALPELGKLVQGIRFPRALLAFLLVIPYFLTAILRLPRQAPWNQAQYQLLAERTTAFASDVGFIKAQPGPVICEDPLVCYTAGKPYLFDTFNVDQLIKTGRMEESTVLALLDAHHFSAIQLSYNPNEPVRPSARLRFSAPFMQKLLATYTPAIRTGDSVIFLARP